MRNIKKYHTSICKNLLVRSFKKCVKIVQNDKIRIL